MMMSCNHIRRLIPHLMHLRSLSMLLRCCSIREGSNRSRHNYRYQLKSLSSLTLPSWPPSCTLYSQSSPFFQLSKTLKGVNTIGHNPEYGYGKRKNIVSRLYRQKGPLVPSSPNMKRRKNLNFLTTYRDLKLRWSRTARAKRLPFMHIKRKRVLRYSSQPEPSPTCSFILHSQMPHRRKMNPLPPIKNLDTNDAFAIVKTSFSKQHKVTRGDLIMMGQISRKQAVLMVGTRDWTIIGKPTSASKWSRFRRTRRYLSIVHVDEIVVDPKVKPEVVPPRPVRLIDIWANRWLDPDEMKGVTYKKDGITPVVQDIFDGREIKPGLYHKNGLTDCYRFIPDPYAPGSNNFEENYRMYDPLAPGEIRKKKIVKLKQLPKSFIQRDPINVSQHFKKIQNM